MDGESIVTNDDYVIYCPRCGASDEQEDFEVIYFEQDRIYVDPDGGRAFYRDTVSLCCHTCKAYFVISDEFSAPLD